jgi:hypothetical protein
MQSVLRHIRKMATEQLLIVSGEIDAELGRRENETEIIPVSAKRRTQQRQKSYRQNNGASAPPVVTIGLGKRVKQRRAA